MRAGRFDVCFNGLLGSEDNAVVLTFRTGQGAQPIAGSDLGGGVDVRAGRGGEGANRIPPDDDLPRSWPRSIAEQRIPDRAQPDKDTTQSQDKNQHGQHLFRGPPWTAPFPGARRGLPQHAGDGVIGIEPQSGRHGSHEAAHEAVSLAIESTVLQAFEGAKRDAGQLCQLDRSHTTQHALSTQILPDRMSFEGLIRSGNLDRVVFQHAHPVAPA